MSLARGLTNAAATTAATVFLAVPGAALGAGASQVAGGTTPPAGGVTAPPVTGVSTGATTPTTSPTGVGQDSNTLAVLTLTNRGATARGGGDGVSGGAVIAAVIAALIALGCLTWGFFRLAAIEPHWLLSARHSLAEAGFRASATWAEFTDWLRLGH